MKRINSSVTIERPGDFPLALSVHLHRVGWTPEKLASESRVSLERISKYLAYGRGSATPARAHINAIAFALYKAYQFQMGLDRLLNELYSEAGWSMAKHPRENRFGRYLEATDNPFLKIGFLFRSPNISWGFSGPEGPRIALVGHLAVLLGASPEWKPYDSAAEIIRDLRSGTLDISGAMPLPVGRMVEIGFLNLPGSAMGQYPATLWLDTNDRQLEAALKLGLDLLAPTSLYGEALADLETSGAHELAIVEDQLSIIHQEVSLIAPPTMRPRAAQRFAVRMGQVSASPPVEFIGYKGDSEKLLQLFEMLQGQTGLSLTQLAAVAQVSLSMMSLIRSSSRPMNPQVWERLRSAVPMTEEFEREFCSVRDEQE